MRQRSGGAGVAAAERRTGEDACAGRRFREEEEKEPLRLTCGARGQVSETGRAGPPTLSTGRSDGSEKKSVGVTIGATLTETERN